VIFSPFTGRAVSLPALSVAAAKGVATTVGAYARIRKQFKVRFAPHLIPECAE
jgi:alkylation response protein AidB-like acyl-CoA dehydrogenase